MSPVVRTVECRSILTKCGIPGVDFSLNPYVGCAHACTYCYASCVVSRFKGRLDPWGTFVDVKANAAQLLKAALKKADGKTVLLSSVTDPYQPLEREKEVTRACLAQFGHGRATVSILTKSDLVVRDIDVLRTLPSVEVGFSMSTVDDRIARALEPGAPPPSRRFAAIEQLARAGFRTWVFIAPAIPGIIETRDQLEEIHSRAREAGAAEVRVDAFNFYPPMTASLLKALQRHLPDSARRFREVLRDKGDYMSHMQAAARELANYHAISSKG